MSFWTWLFPRTPAAYASELSIAQAVQQLRAATARGNITAVGTITGNVDEAQVRLQHEVAGTRNSFKPQFYGSFRKTTQGCELHGSYRMPTLVIVFILFWLGFCVFWTGLSALLAWQINPMQIFIALPGLLMFALGIGLARIGQSMARGDQAVLSRVIAQALQSASV